MTDLLPRNASPLERSLAESMGPTIPAPEVIAALHAPWRIPTALLPHLAVAEDVPPVWPDDEAQRRALIQSSPRLHALIGTPAGLRALTRLAGGRIERLSAGPSKTFLGAWDDESRRRWLASHPEMRIRTQRQRSGAEGFVLSHDFIGVAGTPPARTGALARSAVRAEIVWPNGRIDPLAIHGWSTLTRVAAATVDLARRTGGAGQFIGRPLRGTLSLADARARLWRIGSVNYRERQHVLHVKQMTPSLSPLHPDTEAVAQRAERVGVYCLGLPIGDEHTMRSDAGSRMYLRIRLYDPGVEARSQQGLSYLGYTRLAIAPHTAYAHLRVPARRAPFALAGAALGAGLGASSAISRLTHVLDAMDWARAPHDKVLIKTRLHGRIRASRIHTTGGLVAGQTLLLH